MSLPISPFSAGWHFPKYAVGSALPRRSAGGFQSVLESMIKRRRTVAGQVAAGRRQFPDRRQRGPAFGRPGRAALAIGIRPVPASQEQSGVGLSRGHEDATLKLTALLFPMDQAKKLLSIAQRPPVGHHPDLRHRCGGRRGLVHPLAARGRPAPALHLARARGRQRHRPEAARERSELSHLRKRHQPAGAGSARPRAAPGDGRTRPAQDRPHRI